MRLQHILEQSEQLPSTMYHSTSSERLESIKQNGLKVDSQPLLTQGGNWALQAYGVNPIYLSFTARQFADTDTDVILAVDVQGLPLVADLPSLIDHGALIDEDRVLYWEEGQTPPGNLPEEIEWGELTDPHDPIALQAIQATQSCACLTDISPQRLKVYYNASN